MEQLRENRRFEKELKKLKKRVINKIYFHLRFVTDKKYRFHGKYRIFNRNGIYISSVSETHITYENGTTPTLLSDAQTEDLITILGILES